MEETSLKSQKVNTLLSNVPIQLNKERYIPCSRTGFSNDRSRYRPNDARQSNAVASSNHRRPPDANRRQMQPQQRAPLPKSGGLYREKPPTKPLHPSESLAKMTLGYTPISRVKPPRRYVPCFMKLQRQDIENSNAVEVRPDEEKPDQVWIRLVNRAPQVLQEALEQMQLEPMQKFLRAHPVVIVSDNNRTRGIVLNTYDDMLEYISVDTGFASRTSKNNAFIPTQAVLSIPAAAKRCRMDPQAITQLLGNDFWHTTPTGWLTFQCQILEWSCIPAIHLAPLEHRMKKLKSKPKTVHPSLRERFVEPVQRLFFALPEVTMFKPCHILRDSIILHINRPFAYVASKTASSTVISDLDVPEWKRDAWKTGDIAAVKLRKIIWRVEVQHVEGMMAQVQCVDNGSKYRVDLNELRMTDSLHAPNCFQVMLPPEYFDVIGQDKLDFILTSGVFDILVIDGMEIPLCRIFGKDGLEVSTVENE